MSLPHQARTTAAAPPDAPRSRLHAASWVAWALAGAGAVQLAPGPAYVVVVIAIALLVVAAHASPGPYARAVPVLLAVTGVFVLVRVAITALTAGPGGAEPALVALPSLTLPSALGGFSIGGPVSAAVLAQSVSEGLVILGVVAVFAAFNAVVAHHELVRLVPAALRELGVALTVALAFVPTTVAAVAEVRDADRARVGGGRRRGRLRRTVVPVVARSLERAVRLADSMEARGFGRRPASRRERRGLWLGTLGLVCCAGALAGLVGGAEPAAMSLAIAGGALVVAGLLVTSRAAGRARYRPRRLRRADLAVLAGAAATPVGIALAGALGLGALRWQVGVGWPPFDPAVALFLAGLLVPVLASPGPTSHPPVPDAGGPQQ